MPRLGRLQVRKFDLLRAVDEVDSFWYQVFANLIVLKTQETIDGTDIIEYLAVSQLFDEIEDGTIVPKYNAYFKNHVVKYGGWTSVVTKFDGFKRI